MALAHHANRVAKIKLAVVVPVDVVVVVDVFRVAELVNEGRALTCITYKIFQVPTRMILLTFL